MQVEVSRRRFLFKSLIGGATLLAAFPAAGQTGAPDLNNPSLIDTVSWLRDKITNEAGSTPGQDIGYWTYPAFDIVGGWLTFVQQYHAYPLYPTQPDPEFVVTYTCQLAQLDTNIALPDNLDDTYPHIRIEAVNGDAKINRKYEDCGSPINNVTINVSSFEIYTKTSKLAGRIGKAMTHLILLSQSTTPPAQEIF